MLSLRKEGILLALSGVTSLEEVLRVSRQLDEEV
jgi:type II secretory ATPase GspE/PulE/Tfp pilus assembly ATPase PilB-like protein